MKPLKLVSYSDPAHGWIKVKRQLLIDLNIADKISAYSYQYKEYVYLEEDSDFSKLHMALKEKGIEYSIKENICNNSSRIRTYAQYTKIAPPQFINGAYFRLYGQVYKVLDADNRNVLHLASDMIYRLKRPQLAFIKQVEG
jgi:hypothetical protein